jgi:pyridoxal phosphate enzyme (YggS family)
MSVIPKNLQAVHRRISAALQNARRDAAAVRLIAVSKTFPADLLLEARSLGQEDFGENYLQEALPKMSLVNDQCDRLGLAHPTWHMIGPLQSNKTRSVAEHFDWVHSVDRLKIAERLSSQRPPAMAPLNICLQVNISDEPSKSGAQPAELPALVKALADLPGIELRGLMAVPAPGDGLAFARLATLLGALQAEGLTGSELSMGMSDDLEAAIEHGATMVRVGTAIFGHRIYPGETDPNPSASSVAAT